MVEECSRKLSKPACVRRGNEMQIRGKIRSGVESSHIPKEIIMAGSGSKDKGNKEQKKKPKHNLKEKRKLKEEKKQKSPFAPR